MGELSFSMRDHTNDPGSLTVPTIDLIETNITAQTALFNTLQGTISGVCLGNLVRKSVQATSSPLGVSGPASDPASQRENKAQVVFQNLTTFAPPRYLTVPCVDQDTQMPGHPGYFYLRDYAGEEDAAWTAFIAALEPILSAEAGGDTVEVLSAYQLFTK